MTIFRREMLAEDPTLIGLQLWDGLRLVAEERKRAVATRAKMGKPPTGGFSI